MWAEIINSQRFKSGCASYLEMLTFASDDEVHECGEVAEETLAFVAGEVFSICKKLSDMGLWDSSTTGTLDSLCHSLAGQSVGSGVGLFDNPPPWPLCDEDLEALDKWQRELLGTRTVDTYVGDDGKVYVSGHEHQKPLALKMSLSKGLGRFGYMMHFQAEGVSVNDVALRTAHKLVNEKWNNRWIVGYQETPL